MTLAVIAGGKEIFSETEIADTELTLAFYQSLPVDIEFRVRGKGRFDTEIDSSGRIISDKFVRIDSVLIDRMHIAKWQLESKVIEFVSSDGDTRFTNYLGSNGTAILRIPQSDSFDFFLDLRTQNTKPISGQPIKGITL